MVVGEIDADRDPRGRNQPQQDGGPAFPRLPLTPAVTFFDDEAESLQLTDEAADGRPGQPGHLRQVATARRSPQAEGVNHASAVSLAQDARLPASQLRHLDTF